MTDAVATPDLLPVPPEATPQDAPPPVVPTADDAPPPDRRRRYLLLLLLFGLLALVIAFAVWYFIFRQPITAILPPDIAKPPAYVSSTYGVNQPLGVAVSSDGSHIYVTQGGGDESTVLLDPSGNKLAVLAPPTDVTASASQLYVAVNPKTGDVYATSRVNGAVYIYGADGAFKNTFDPGATITTWQPLAITFDTDGNLYVSDVGGDFQQIRVFGPDGTWLRDIGTAGLFSFPNGIAVDKSGNVYVADSNNGRLVVFDKTGTQLGAVQRGPADGQLGMPRGVVADSEGRIYVVDAVGQSVQLFKAIQGTDTTPAYLTKFGTEGTVDGAFEYPNGIALDGRGRVYVADWNNNRLQVWSY